MPQADSLTRFQERFHRRWQALHDPHVRALAWLLDAPDLLGAENGPWAGAVGSLREHAILGDFSDFLFRLDRQPAALHAVLNIHPYTRLGRYAENLLAFYLKHAGVLLAHGVQVRAARNNTVGEFDYLLELQERCVHWEFATKFYLLESGGAGHDADYFVGPNLADTLGAKMSKIFQRQLQLAHHPAAAAVLPRPVDIAQALVKGWLFYRSGEVTSVPGVAHNHCHGFWRPLQELDLLEAERFAILPRLEWLAPARVTWNDALSYETLHQMLQDHFAHDSMPVMVALLRHEDDVGLEVDRGFVVPDDWRTRAGQRIGLAHQP